MAQDNIEAGFKTGVELLAAFNCTTRESKLEQAVKALMAELNDMHTEHLDQDLQENLTNTEIHCSHSDAYRMGMEALK